MIYKLEPEKDNNFYDLYLYKSVNKRDGTKDIGIDERIYGVTISDALNILAHKETQHYFKDEDVSLREYLKSFYKYWKTFKDENSRT